MSKVTYDSMLGMLKQATGLTGKEGVRYYPNIGSVPGDRFGLNKRLHVSYEFKAKAFNVFLSDIILTIKLLKKGDEVFDYYSLSSYRKSFLRKSLLDLVPFVVTDHTAREDRWHKRLSYSSFIGAYAEFENGDRKCIPFKRGNSGDAETGFAISRDTGKVLLLTTSAGVLDEGTAFVSGVAAGLTSDRRAVAPIYETLDPREWLSYLLSNYGRPFAEKAADFYKRAVDAVRPYPDAILALGYGRSLQAHGFTQYCDLQVESQKDVPSLTWIRTVIGNAQKTFVIPDTRWMVDSGEKGKEYRYCMGLDAREPNPFIADYELVQVGMPTFANKKHVRFNDGIKEFVSDMALHDIPVC
jgi:hypothetical protein